MSGGHFDYDQYKIGQISDQVHHLILSNEDKTKDEYGYPMGREYGPGTIEKFKEGLKFLRLAEIYAQRIDWLISGDDGEDSFLERLEEELKGLKNE